MVSPVGINIEAILNEFYIRGVYRYDNIIYVYTSVCKCACECIYECVSGCFTIIVRDARNLRGAVEHRVVHGKSRKEEIKWKKCNYILI